ncbi:hypothetical protein SADO_00715 [Salinisphaera dokdonensis CL-ES53]|uniref:Polysaccharide pyruvyl transferase domain-containing protein n=1 Tax=Salinisphaera dokdonensis CL-ES53 TaxID=1304272 RepID=A0ABV2AVU4_9GAMM
MWIEIRRAGFTNKGAELMLRATLEQMSSEFPDARFVMQPGHDSSSSPYLARARLGFYQKASLWRYRVQWGDFARFAPSKLREMFGLVLDHQVDVILDAGGFVYSDQWGTGPVQELRRSTTRWRRRGAKVILLPQAFGPFTTPSMRSEFSRAFENTDLVFARDQESYRNIVELVGEQKKLRLAPDFTNLLEGELPGWFNAQAHQFCIVPNARMIDKQPGVRSSDYLAFLERVVAAFLNRGVKPFVLIHEGEEDHKLGEALSARVGGLEVRVERNPLLLKGVLGNCLGTVGSRYHGLISSLSSGVPSLGIGWSHKYAELFSEYEFPEGMLKLGDEKSMIAEKLDILLDTRSRQEASDRLMQKSEQIKTQARAMWGEVIKVARGA